MRQKFTPVIIGACVSMLSLLQMPASAGGDRPTLLQQAVNTIDKNPKLAAHELKRLPGASAKVFLAYLYITHKVQTGQSGKEIDTLMDKAISEISDPDALGDVQPGKHYHYTSIKMLLRHMRFITDADGAPVQIPVSVFKQYPEEAFAAFQPYWGSRRDSFLPIEVSKQDDIDQLAAVQGYLGTLGTMCGDPYETCTGTIRYRFYRLQALADIQASLAPRLCLKEARSDEQELSQHQLDKFLHTWANQELWNWQTFQRLNREFKAAQMPLADFYQKRFKYSQAESTECAKAALQSIAMAYLGEYSSSIVEDSAKNTVYSIFSDGTLTLSSLDRQLNGKTLTQEELAEALRLATLNGTSMEVIDWILQKGAPVKGGSESPLFTAVLRPPVISALIKAGVDVNETNPIGKTALFQAAQYNAGETIRILLDAGADVKHTMIKSDSEEATKANESCEFNYTIGSRTPLMYAVAFCDYPTIMYLLRKGSDKAAVDSKGEKAIKYLSWNKILNKSDKARLIAELSH